mmetsp:Transcript_14023/g.17665  ORF Transcript_14023/g.17665 Transcript_14023/m.17665 type:complete len:244 (+) Transcript_14023:123-854(+)
MCTNNDHYPGGILRMSSRDLRWSSSSSSSSLPLSHETSSTRDATTMLPPVTTTKRRKRSFRNVKIDCPYKGMTSARRNRNEGVGNAAGLPPMHDSPRTVVAGIATDEMMTREGGGRSRRCVKMGEIEIRTYPVILGDHPECSAGPPVTIDWDYSRRQILNLDEYESSRRCKRSNLVISYYDRKKLLKSFFRYSDREIDEAISEVNRIKRQRQWTRKMLRLSKLQEVFVEAVRIPFVRRGGSVR